MAASSITLEFTIPLTESEYLYIGQFTPSTSFPVGGEPIDIPGNTHIRKMFTDSGGGYASQFLEGTQALKFYRGKDPGNAGGADIALQVVTTAADISAGGPFNYMAIGS